MRYHCLDHIIVKDPMGELRSSLAHLSPASGRRDGPGSRVIVPGGGRKKAQKKDVGGVIEAGRVCGQKKNRKKDIEGGHGCGGRGKRLREESVRLPRSDR